MSWNLFDLEVKRRVAHRHRVLPRVAAYSEQLLKDINPFTAHPLLEILGHAALGDDPAAP